MRVFALVLLAAVASAQILKSDNLEVVDGEYIVVFHNNVSTDLMDKHVSMVDGKIMFRYNMPTFKGYAVAHKDYNKMLSIAEQPEVNFVEHNGVARALDAQPQCVEFTEARSWGLPRVSNRQRVITGNMRADTNPGQQVDIYIIDTGLLATHQDFGGRVATGAGDRFDSTGEGPGDQNGHGTHCGSTAAGEVYGISRESDVFEVKVLGRSGGGSFAGVIAGIDWTANRQGQRKIGSLSLGGGFSAAVNAATDAAVAAGSIMSVASGNSNANACNFSPASAPRSISVNSMTNTDARSGFSNFGTCTDIFAPGSSITAAWIGSNTATNTISGTSMACPHVTGVAAQYWGANPNLDMDEVKTAILADATPNVITNPGAGSPNLLAFTC